MTDPATITVQRPCTDAQSVGDEAFVAWATAALQGAVAEIGIRLVDEPEARQLNLDYRGRDYATNVLSFPLDDAVLSQHQQGLFGDLIICPKVVQREAAEQGKAFDQHLAHLVVHGVLHLRGYDHQRDQDGAQMEALERDILAALGYPDPYQ